MDIDEDEVYDVRKTGRMHPKRRFRALVRLVIENAPWLSESVFGVKHAGRKIMKSNLTLEHKVILNKAPNDRTEEENYMIYKCIGGLKCFRKYPETVKMMLANYCRFAFFGPDRIIIREGHYATAIFFLVSGEVNLIEEKFDAFLNETERVVSEVLSAGDGFGEICLLHNLPRMETIASASPVEFLVLKREDFDFVLKGTVMDEWNHISSLMHTFEYFQRWDKVRLGEACMQAIVTDYKKNDTILGDGYGRKNYVYFVLEGSCSLVEHMFVQETKYPSGRSTFQLRIQNTSLSSISFEDSLPSPAPPLNNKTVQINETHDDTPLARSIKTSMYHVSQHDAGDKRNRVSIRRNNTSLLRESSSSPLVIKNIPADAEVIFMQVCIFTQKACFSLGENMRNRRVVALEDVSCLLIPAYLLIGRDMIWMRIRQFLQTRIPSTDMIFAHFVRERNWRQHKTKLAAPLLSQYCENWHGNIPYTIRISSDFEFKRSARNPATRRDMS